jgi:hypothetical protein
MQVSRFEAKRFVQVTTSQGEIQGLGAMAKQNAASIPIAKDWALETKIRENLWRKFYWIQLN